MDGRVDGQVDGHRSYIYNSRKNILLYMLLENKNSFLLFTN